MLINLRNALMTGKRTPTAKDYVQNGLVAMWDGIENAGWGVHDATITNEWTDLVAGKKVVASIGSTSFADNHLIANGAVLSSTLGNLVSLLNTGTFTIEWLQYHTDARGYVFNGNNTRPLYEIWENDGRGMYLRLYGEANYGELGYRIGAPKNLTTHMVYTVNPTDGVYGFVNGVKYRGASKFSVGAQRTESDAIALIGNRSSNWTYFNGKVYFVRLYSRALTTEEIARNYSIDKERFNLP